jgi:hypothetical protein
MTFFKNIEYIFLYYILNKYLSIKKPNYISSIMKKLLRILSTGITLISFLIFIYVIYRSEFYYSGTLRDYYLRYYIFSFIFIIISILIIVLPDKIKINIFIIFFSLIFSFYSIELFYFFKKSLIFNNQTNKIEFYNNLKKNEDVTLSINPSALLKYNYNLLPLSGISNSKTIHCNENGYFSIYKSDRYGFNNQDDLWDKKEIDYVLLGDSWTHGSCVNSEYTISSFLQKYSNKYALNLGMSGNGSLLEYATLKEYSPNRTVKRFLLIYFENDIIDLSVELKNNILIKYLKDSTYSQNLKFRQKEINTMLNELSAKERVIIEEDINNNKKRSIFNSTSQFIKLYNLRKIIFFKKEITRADDLIIPDEFKEILIKMNNEVISRNSKFYFIYIPYHFEFNNKNYKNVVKIVNELHINLIDLKTEIMDKHNDIHSLYPYRKRGHFNETGYSLIAKIIYEKIQEFEKLY